MKFQQAMWLATLVGTFSLCTGGADAQSSGGIYRLDPVVIAGGGGSASGGVYALQGSYAQSVTTVSSGGDLSLYGGFWAPAGLVTCADCIFANGFESP